MKRVSKHNHNRQVMTCSSPALPPAELHCSSRCIVPLCCSAWDTQPLGSQALVHAYKVTAGVHRKTTCYLITFVRNRSSILVHRSACTHVHWPRHRTVGLAYGHDYEHRGGSQLPAAEMIHWKLLVGDAAMKKTLRKMHAAIPHVFDKCQQISGGSYS